MKVISYSTAFALLAGTALIAQDSPKADVSLLYSYLHTTPARGIPSFESHGGVGTLGYNFNKYLAFEAEFGGYHAPGPANFDTTQFTYLFGPRLSFSRARRFVPYIHTLFGGVHVTTSAPVLLVPTPVGTTPTGTLTRAEASQDNFAMAVGFGLDIKLGHHVMLRPIQLDYLLTRLEDLGQSGQPSQNRNQHNGRYAAGLVFTFGGERPSPPPPPPPPPDAPPRMKSCPGGQSVRIDQECPKQDFKVGIASPTQVCPGSRTSITTNTRLPAGATAHWAIDGTPASDEPSVMFSAPREQGSHKITLRVSADGFNDAFGDTVINVGGYTPPSGSVSVSPSEIWVGEKATLTPSFSVGQCGGTLEPVTYSVTEGSISGNEYDSTSVQFAPPGSSEQRRTVTVTAKATDGQGTGTAQTSLVVKQRPVNQAQRLPDILFASGSDRVNNCGKRVLLDELKRLADADPTGKVVLVGHASDTEKASEALGTRRALNAAAVISAGQGVCTAFPASQIVVNAVGGVENGVSYQPNFCAGSTAVTEKPGQVVAPTDAVAKFRRVEVWFVPTGGVMPPSGEGGKVAGTLGLNRLGCPQ